MSNDNPHRRNGDKSHLAALADNAVFTLASRGALVVVMGLVAWLAMRSLDKLEKMSDSLASISTDVRVVSTELSSQSKRLDLIEKQVFKVGGP